MKNAALRTALAVDDLCTRYLQFRHYHGAGEEERPGTPAARAGGGEEDRGRESARSVCTHPRQYERSPKIHIHDILFRRKHIHIDAEEEIASVWQKKMANRKRFAIFLTSFLFPVYYPAIFI